MNAYFQIVNNNGFCGVKLVPPTDGGAPILREELLEYLSIKNMVYDVKALGQILLAHTETVVFPTQTPFQFKEGEFVKVSIAPDNMSVTVRVIPPFEGGPLMAKPEFVREFTSRGVKFGMDEKVVDDFLAKRQYCTSIVMAKGKPPVHGTDASIEYFFNTDPRVRPTLNEDGSVDFFNLNTISHCLEGDVLARLTPATMGEPGMNVKGERIRPREVKIQNLKYGHNIKITEDKTELISEVSGHVNLVEGKVFVSNVLTVENVDNSVGNIDYDGSVTINGNVCENFIVKARGTINVKGVVEGAIIEAGKDIIIARGMNGMHKGKLVAGGNIISKFIENADCRAEGYISTESIMHSTVVAGADIKVTGKHGFISGGRACASHSIEAKTLGSTMGADTIIEVGVDASVKTKLASFQREVIEINKTLAQVRPVIEGARQKLAAGIKMSTEQLLQVQKLAVINKEKTERLETIMSEMEILDGGDPETKGQVIVTGSVYPGTKICIGDVSMVVKNAVKYCRFIKEAGDVKMTALY